MAVHYNIEENIVTVTVIVIVIVTVIVILMDFECEHTWATRFPFAQHPYSYYCIYSKVFALFCLHTPPDHLHYQS